MAVEAADVAGAGVEKEGRALGAKVVLFDHIPYKAKLIQL